MKKRKWVAVWLRDMIKFPIYPKFPRLPLCNNMNRSSTWRRGSNEQVVLEKLFYFLFDKTQLFRRWMSNPSFNIIAIRDSVTFYYRSICIIDNGASRRRTRNACFRARRADHLHAVMFNVMFDVLCDYTRLKNLFIIRNKSLKKTGFVEQCIVSDISCTYTNVTLLHSLQFG